MSIISTMYGEVLDGEYKFHHEVGDEKFYTINVKFRDAIIDVMLSQYLREDLPLKGKVKVTGFLASIPARKDVPYFYFYANLIERVDVDTPITNDVKFNYKVTHTSKFKTNNRGVDMLPLVASDYNPLHQTSVLYLCARDVNARMLKDRPMNYFITGSGYLKQYRDIYEILIHTVEEIKDVKDSIPTDVSRMSNTNLD